MAPECIAMPHHRQMLPDMPRPHCCRIPAPQMFANFWRAVSEPWIVESLSQSGERDKEAVAATVEALFDCMAAAAALNPQPMQYPATRVLLCRKGATPSSDSSNNNGSM